MTRPSERDVLRCLLGEQVFEADVCQQIRAAGEALPARVLFEAVLESTGVQHLVGLLSRLVTLATTGDVAWRPLGGIEDEEDVEEQDGADVPREQRVEACFRVRFVAVERISIEDFWSRVE